MGRPSKYKKQFAAELRDGLRDSPYMTIDRVCRQWDISRTTYYEWIEKYPDFAEAHEAGERDYRINIYDVVVKNATGEYRGNGSVVTLMANHALGMTQKKELNVTQDTQVKRLEIELVDGQKLLDDKTIDAEFEEVDEDD